MTRLRRFAPTAPAEWPWNGWPNAAGIAGRMLVEQVAKWRGMRKHAAGGALTASTTAATDPLPADTDAPAATAAAGPNSATTAIAPTSMPKAIGTTARPGGKLVPDPAVMERIAAADSYLRSLFGDLPLSLDDGDRQRLQQDGAFRDWMAEVESKLGDQLTPRMRQEMRERQVATVDLRNRLQEAYFSGAISWPAYIEGLRSVSLWSDEPFQRLLSEDEYQQLNGVAKAEIGSLSDAVLDLPEPIEAVNLFPQIREGRPELTEQELVSVIPQLQLDRLTGLRKSQMLQESALAADLDSGRIDMDAYLVAVKQNEADLAAEAVSMLSPEGYRLLFPDDAPAE